MLITQRKDRIVRNLKVTLEPGEWEALVKGLTDSEERIRDDMGWLKPIFHIVIGRAFK